MNDSMNQKNATPESKVFHKNSATLGNHRLKSKEDFVLLEIVVKLVRIFSLRMNNCPKFTCLPHRLLY